MQLQRAMIFIDGTNLFYRLEAARLVQRVSPRFSRAFHLSAAVAR